jgi:hypothetical protein
MDYRKMITDFANNGGDEKKMWASVAVTSEAMEYLKEVAPEKHECLMRKLSETLYGKHYSEEIAKDDVAKMHWTDRDGNEHHGAYWTAEQIESVAKSKDFGKAVTKWDRYVAYNATYADLCRVLEDEQILDVAYAFWFADEDWKTSGKIWDYMSANK